MKDLAYHFERNDTIQIGLINVDFTTIDSTALKQSDPKLDLVNATLHKMASKNPYITNHSIVIAPLNSTNLVGSSIHFEFGKIVLNNSTKRINNIMAHFDEGQSYSLLQNGNLNNSSFDVNFGQGGIKEITFDITYIDNTTQTTYANFYVSPSRTVANGVNSAVSDVLPIYSNRRFQGYTEPSNCDGNCYGEGEYKVYFANGNTEITKPFIIVDGFDPGDNRKIDEDEALSPDDEHLYGLMDYAGSNLVDDLNSKGYDVIILSFPKYIISQRVVNGWLFTRYGPVNRTYTINTYRDGGADYIERNAGVLQTLIAVINSGLTNGNSIKVAGPSMGALIVQYALAEMEDNGENHNVDLFVSFDGPHKGANISIGMQKAVQYFDVEAAKTPLESPAAKQMLINHYLANGDGIPRGAPQFRNRFQYSLDRLGMPRDSRNIAIINGSLIGEEKSETDGNFANANLTVLYGFFSRKVWVNYTSDSGKKTVFRYQRKNWWGANVQSDIRKENTTSYSYGSLDNASGGFINIKGRIEEQVGSDFPFYYFAGFTNVNFRNLGFNFFESIGIQTLLNLFAASFYLDMNDDFSFVPTKSALAFTGANKLWRECIGSRNLVCTGETPFDSYYAPTVNQEHASLNQDGIDWLLEEVDDMPHLIPKLYPSCSLASELLKIDGQNTLCLNDTAIFTIPPAAQCSGLSVNWTTSNNLEIIRSNPSEIEVRLIAETSNTWIRASAGGVNDTKNIVSKPQITFDMSNAQRNSQIELIGDVVNLGMQRINSIVWTKTSGNGTLSTSNNSRTATGSGSTNAYWYIRGNVAVTNSCGTTTKPFFITIGIQPIGDCNDLTSSNNLYIQKIGDNTYKVINICNDQILTIYSSELYNVYGVKTDDLISIEDDVEFNSMVNSGVIKILKVEVDGKILTKRIITD
jgi:hypothetical protein